MSPDYLPAAHRFRDPLGRVDRLASEVLVRCPNCQGRALLLANLGDRRAEGPSGHVTVAVQVRLRCPACGLCQDECLQSASYLDDPVDPYRRLPLWLQAECCGGHVLWAYNAAHLDLLESYVAARLRERGDVLGSMSMVERLPAWLKSRHHRDEILRVIARLRATLDGP